MCRRTFPTSAAAASRTAVFSEDSAEVQADTHLLAYEVVPGHTLHGGEIVLFAIKPSMWYLVFVAVRWLAAAAAVVVITPWLSAAYPAVPERLLTHTVLALTALRLVAALLQWSSRLYVLTNRRVMSCRGVLQVKIFESPLVRIRNTYIKVSRCFRICRMGSIGFSLQGSRAVDAWWDHVPNPKEIHDQIRAAIEKALDHHLPY